jgi:hypothetical protein
VRNNTTYQTTSYTPDNLPAIYERDIAKIYLQYFTHNDDTLISTADIDRLIEIANKCPIVSGYAVYDELLNMTDTLGNSLNDSLYLNKLNNIQILLAQLSCNSLASINERIVYTIFTNTLAEGVDTLNESYKLILEDIALQCPVSGGNAVYDAIALLTTFYPELQFNVFENCLNNGLRLDDATFESIELNERVHQNDVSVFPNPTSGILYVQNPSTDNTLLKITDVTGRLIISKIIEPNSINTVPDLIHLPSGIYLYQIVGSNTLNGKIVKSDAQ